MTRPDPRRVAATHLLSRGHLKAAGEVIFKKDRSGDVGSWAYANNPPSQREIPNDFNYSPRNQKPLAKVLRSTLAALGHTLSAYNRFAKMKSARLSPDGSLGGRGYIQKIADMRKQYMNCVEALSALSDTFHDEINAPHWSVLSRQEHGQERAEIEAIIDDSETIREDPENWAENEMLEEFGMGLSDEDEFEEPLEEPFEESLGDAWGETEASTEPEVEPWMNPSVFSKRAQVTPAIGRIAKAWLDHMDHSKDLEEHR